MKSIKQIAEECFLIENWEMKGWNQESIDFIRERPDRDKFIEEVVTMFENNKMMFLSGNEWHRGIGKSEFLLEVADEYNFPLAVGLRGHVRLLENRYLYKKKKPCDLKIDVFEKLKGKLEGHKYILIDELVSDETIKEIKELGLIPIGFKTASKYYKLI